MSNIREKLRSTVLKDLAKERTTKRLKTTHSDDDETDEPTTSSKNSLLSILPAPKNASPFGPTVKLDKLLKLPERVECRPENPTEILNEDGIIEVDVNKVVGDVTPSLVKELTIEKATHSVGVIPKGREKQKNQITYLAQLGKATELERKEQAAQSRINKAAARSKYGW